ncbi:cardiolipin synthase [Adhaeribacter aerolatus]|uniref:Cardiolipin synthase n=1 Tax=Adhaeribacter aerolatus TaxID=670289 RepID=A0A512AW28_9BACT|nr:cardiolipin synthase [Adhaeribacter aerolatus]GEO03880.1 cardiolipin synthase [Adhaeribacter aerolatus]
MNWILISDIIYIVLLVPVSLQIIRDTRSSTKTLAYLLLVIFLPVFGIIFYFSFGINYHKRQVYTKKLFDDEVLGTELRERIISKTHTNLLNNQAAIQDGKSLVNLLLKDSWSPLTEGNRVKFLFNGEEKFPELLHALRGATHHIHLEYYIIENDIISNQLKEVLIQKARQGVQVRVIYDDFGSRAIRKKFVRELHQGGVEAYPFNRIKLLFLANRLNYRNHRKIIIVDGKCGFVGGINISDRYINRPESQNEYYWRDTHLRIDGPGIFYLQYIFFCDWNFCSRQRLTPETIYFSSPKPDDANVNVQIAASGPDSPTPTIMLSIFKAINLARKEILITTPYFIPGESLLDALKVAALSGVAVKLLAPGFSDSRLVNAAAWSYYDDLLTAGVEIYMYRKGFVHAKTMVVDGYISVVGTANMDFRSYELNFEVNALVYGEETATQLAQAFTNDLFHAEKLIPATWANRSGYKKLFERIARLLSPLL